MVYATKEETVAAFKKLKQLPDNKVGVAASVRRGPAVNHTRRVSDRCRFASTAWRGTPRGPRSRMASSSAWTAPPCTGAWASTSRLCGEAAGFVLGRLPRSRVPPRPLPLRRSCDLDKWTEEQLHTMRLGGNGNAKIFFEQKGWTAKDASSMVRLPFLCPSLPCACA